MNIFVWSKYGGLRVLALQLISITFKFAFELSKLCQTKFKSLVKFLCWFSSENKLNYLQTRWFNWCICITNCFRPFATFSISVSFYFHPFISFFIPASFWRRATNHHVTTIFLQILLLNMAICGTLNWLRLNCRFDSHTNQYFRIKRIRPAKHCHFLVFNDFFFLFFFVACAQCGRTCNLCSDKKMGF